RDPPHAATKGGAPMTAQPAALWPSPGPPFPATGRGAYAIRALPDRNLFPLFPPPYRARVPGNPHWQEDVGFHFLPNVGISGEGKFAARARSFSASTFSGPGLLLPARLSGVSIHRRLALGGHGGFGAGIRRRGVRRCRLDIDHATRPAEIVG